MIYMNCPSCDAQGRIPDEKVNTAIVCKKCLKTFHVKPSGHAVLGGPPIAGTEGGRHEAHPHEIDHSVDVDQWLEKLNVSLHKLGRIAAVLAAMVVAYSAYRWSQPTLEDRIAATATALVQADRNAVRALAVRGTDEAAVKWLEELHPEVRESIQASASTVPITTMIATERDPRTGAVTVRARISPEVLVGRKAVVEGAAPSAAVVAQSIDVPLVLESGLWSGWRLDGKRTLEAFHKEAGRGLAKVDRR